MSEMRFDPITEGAIAAFSPEVQEEIRSGLECDFEDPPFDLVEDRKNFVEFAKAALVGLCSGAPEAAGGWLAKRAFEIAEACIEEQDRL